MADPILRQDDDRAGPMTERRTDDPAHFQGREFRADGPTVREGYKEASLSVTGISDRASHG